MLMSRHRFAGVFTRHTTSAISSKVVGDVIQAGERPGMWIDYYLSSGGGSFSSVGSTPQISRAYWAMVRSLENLPHPAML